MRAPGRLATAHRSVVSKVLKGECLAVVSLKKGWVQFDALLRVAQGLERPPELEPRRRALAP